MSLPVLLHRGASYRRSELDVALIGLLKSRVSISPECPIIMLFASVRGKVRSQWGDDGFYHFCDEVPNGLPAMSQNHQAIIEHVQNRRRLALFTPVNDDLYRFCGYMNYVDHDHPLSSSSSNRCIIFRLVASANYPAEQITLKASAPLATRREQACLASRQDPSPVHLFDYQQRSAKVAEYVQARAGGFCEGCGLPAPFADMNHFPYLETHHLSRLDDNAPDPPTIVAALCPTCHERAHRTIKAEEFNCALAKQTQDLEHAAASGTQLRVVAAILITKGDRVFIAQRDSGPLSGHWEFPGGKVEENETLVAALRRELAEELGITAEQITPFMRVDHQYASFHLRLFSFTATSKQRPLSTEHRQTRWVERSHLAQFNWAPADQPIVAALQFYPLFRRNP